MSDRLKVFLNPVGLHSRAMTRVARALRRYAPPEVQVTDFVPEADLQIHHVIGADYLHGADENQPHAMIQYCWRSAGGNESFWEAAWKRAQLVWSYYDLTQQPGVHGDAVNFYHAPLGVDPIFAAAQPDGLVRGIDVMTSGYVSAHCAEAIEEMAEAASLCGLRTLHLGPRNVEGMRRIPANWSAISGITDAELVNFLKRVKWVSGLRQVEGFELPAIEGLACGARPILFDRPEIRQWYDGFGVFVPPCSGEELVHTLVDVLQGPRQEVGEAERRAVLDRFNWETIATGFWERLL